MFKCYICGKEYETPIEAANCTIECTKKQEIEKEELRRKEIAEQRRKESLKVLRDTITKQYEGLKNNVNKYNALKPDYELKCTLTTVTDNPNKVANKALEKEPGNEYMDNIINLLRILNGCE
jgi:hypothetical protein